MDLTLGIDVGTTTVKALAMDCLGQVIAFASAGLHLLTPQPAWVEQNPEELWLAVINVCRKVTDTLPDGAHILALSLSSQGGTTILLDACNQPVYPALSWMDERAVDEAQAVRATRGEEWIYRTTGWPLYAGLPLQLVAWLRHNNPKAFELTRRVTFVNDFILHRLCGEFCMDPSNAGITQLYNLAAGVWDAELLDLAGISGCQLSPICPSGKVVGKVSGEASRLTGLSSQTLVVNGAHDQYCASVGTGVTRPGTVLLSCGTAWVILVIPESLAAAFSSNLAVSPHAIEGQWGGIRSLSGVGASLDWLVDIFWEDSPSRANRLDLYAAFDAAASQSPAGARGLLFNPLSGGHRETGDPANRGVLGLTLNHSRGDLARALMEGIACELRWSLDEIHPAIAVDSLRMIGGAARSAIWSQAIADLTGIPVELPMNHEAAALGAAILAGVGLGWYPDPAAVFDNLPGRPDRVMPDPRNWDVYDSLYHRYQQLWELVPHKTFA
jgi:sugar (pentulose or hexulose) kinase